MDNRLWVPDTIAIDGPVATGKSVVGKLLAQELRYRFLDSGIMYRALTWLSLEQGIHSRDHGSLIRLSETSTIHVTLEQDEVFINGVEVPLETERIRIDKRVSLISQVPEIRNQLVSQQQRLAESGRIVIVGRDIGTVVLPNAALKLYFQAPPGERTKRRYNELRARGHTVEFNHVFRDIINRDKIDTERTHSPLKPAHDAHLVDTKGMTIQEVVQYILELVKRL